MRFKRDSNNATDVLTVKKVGKLLKQPKGENANFGLDDVQTELKTLEDRAMTLKNKAIVRTDTNIQSMRPEVETIVARAQNIEKTIEHSRPKIEIIELRAQNIEKMIEKLAPVLTEMRSLLRETRLLMDAIAKATKSGIQINGIGIQKQGTNAIPIPVVGGCGEYGRYKKWGKITIFLIGWRAFTQVTREGRADPQYLNNLLPDSSGFRTRDARGHPICKSPIHHDHLTNTDIR